MPQKLDFKESDLQPGITLLHHRSTKWKTEVFRLFFAAPLAAKVAERALAAYLLRHGHSGMRGMDAVSKHMQDLFGANLSTFVSKSNDRHFLTVRGATVAADYIPGRSDPMAGLLTYLDKLLNRPWFAEPKFETSVLERERKNLLRAIDAIRDNKAQWAEQRIAEEMFRGHSLARPAYGFRAEVETAAADAVIAEFKRVIADAPLLIYVVSPRSTRDLKAVLKKSLSLGPRAALAKSRVKAPAIRSRPLRVMDHDQVIQGRLALGFRTNDYRRERDVHAAVLADMLLGGSSSSRLFKEVREKRSLAYSIHSSFDAGSGSSLVSAGVDPLQFSAVEKLVRKEIKRLASGKIAASDLETVLITIKKQLEGIGDSPDAMISFHSSRKLGQRQEVDPESVLAKYARVKPERIAEQASRLVLDTVYALGPKEIA